MTVMCYFNTEDMRVEANEANLCLIPSLSTLDSGEQLHNNDTTVVCR